MALLLISRTRTIVLYCLLSQAVRSIYSPFVIHASMMTHLRSYYSMIRFSNGDVYKEFPDFSHLQPIHIVLHIVQTEPEDRVEPVQAGDDTAKYKDPMCPRGDSFLLAGDDFRLYLR